MIHIYLKNTCGQIDGKLNILGHNFTRNFFFLHFCMYNHHEFLKRFFKHPVIILHVLPGWVIILSCKSKTVGNVFIISRQTALHWSADHYHSYWTYQSPSTIQTIICFQCVPPVSPSHCVMFPWWIWHGII